MIVLHFEWRRCSWLFLLQKRTKSLRHLRENVCLTAATQDRLYAVGSQSHVTLVDDRLTRDVCIIPSKQRGCGQWLMYSSFDFVLWLMHFDSDCLHDIFHGSCWLVHCTIYTDFFKDNPQGRCVKLCACCISLKWYLICWWFWRCRMGINS